MHRTTRHALDRRAQRGIPACVLELAATEGRPLSHNGDRYLLGPEEIADLLAEGRVDQGLLRRAERCGPVVCVVRCGRIVTAFRPTRRIDRRR
jgi:hypothetical protein